MGRRCFISFKKEDEEYKIKIQEELNVDMVDYSLDDAIVSDDEEYILRKLREDYISKATVTIHLIGRFSAESLGWEEQKFIKRELQASLYHGVGNSQNGILGIVLPDAYNLVYRGAYTCNVCGLRHNYVNVKDTTVTEFSYNYHIPNDKCSWSEDDKFCVLTRWDDFIVDPDKYVEMAFAKRENPIAEKTKVRP
jgi:hypothetical protein